MAPRSLEQHLRGYRKLAVLAPHPDDEIFGGFGMIRLAQRLGLEIEVHVVSDGERCFGPLPACEEEALRQARRAESCQAAALLGYAAPNFWQFGDSQLMEQTPLIERQLRNQWRADTLCLAPWWHDGHPDHDAVALSLRQVAAPQACIYYPVWALIDLERRAEFFAQDGVEAITLTPAEHALKQQAAALFATQFSRHEGDQGAIIREDFLAEFTADHEYYLHDA